MKKLPYSRNESALLSLLKSGRKLSTTRIVELHYPDGARPQYARQSVVSVLNLLVEKVRKNDEPFRLRKSKRLGPYPSSYWIEKL